MQKVLMQQPALEEHAKSIEEVGLLSRHRTNPHPPLQPPGSAPPQGLDRWQLKVQRAADKNFDKFELYALNNVFRVPAELTKAPVDGADQSGIDAELEELWAQLRQELATKSELQQRVAVASRETQRWEAHKQAVDDLCTTRRSDALGRVLHEARQLDEELRRGREQLHGSGSAEGPACVQKGLSDRRIEISTVTQPLRGGAPPPPQTHFLPPKPRCAGKRMHSRLCFVAPCAGLHPPPRLSLVQAGVSDLKVLSSMLCT